MRNFFSFSFHKSGVFILWLLLFLAASWGVVSLGWAFRANQFEPLFGEAKSSAFYATIVSDPAARGKYAQKFFVAPQGYSENILVTAYGKEDFQYGDKVFIRGKPKAPQEFDQHFDYVRYLQSENIFAQMNSSEIYVLAHSPGNPAIYYGLKIKHLFYSALQKYLQPRPAALLIALLVGDKGLMPAQDIADFSRVGVAHLIAVSSYVLTVTLILASRLKPYLGRALTIVLCLTIILLNLIMADFSAGMMRAAIMFALLFIAKNLGRQYAAMPALIFTAAVLVAANPLIIKYDVGFMLSFGSIVGIILFAPLISAQLAKFPRAIPEKFGIREILATTLAAQLASVPLTIYYFQQLPLVSPISNLILEPLATPTTIVAYTLLLPWLGHIAAAVLNLPLQFMLATVHFLSQFKFASVNLGISAPIFVLLYVLEAGAYFLLRYISKSRPEAAEAPQPNYIDKNNLKDN